MQREKHKFVSEPKVVLSDPTIWCDHGLRVTEDDHSL